MESVFAPTPHPAHWVGAALDVAAGYLAGSLVAVREGSGGR